MAVSMFMLVITAMTFMFTVAVFVFMRAQFGKLRYFNVRLKGMNRIFYNFVNSIVVLCMKDK